MKKTTFEREEVQNSICFFSMISFVLGVSLCSLVLTKSYNSILHKENICKEYKGEFVESVKDDFSNESLSPLIKNNKFKVTLICESK